MHAGDNGFKDKRFPMIKERHRGTFEKALGEGKVDPQMVSLCRFVAKGTRDYFTSSCCSGRILLIDLPKGEDKLGSRFHRKWHRTVEFKELWEGMQAPSAGELWFKQEPFILHLGCPDLEHAQKILAAMKKTGVKRGGIMFAEEGKYMIELMGTQNISVPVKKGGKVLIEKKHLEYLLQRANEKLKKNYALLKKFERNCRSLLAPEGLK